MKTQITTLAAALVLLSAPCFAQIVSSPLEPGLYDFMKAHASASYSLMLVNDNAMTVNSGTHVEYISPEQITISGIVARINTSSSTMDRIRRMIDDYNFSAAVGTMLLDDKSGIVTLQHFVNPKLAKLAEMATTVTTFSDALRQQSSRFNGSFGESVKPVVDCTSMACAANH